MPPVEDILPVPDGDNAAPTPPQEVMQAAPPSNPLPKGFELLQDGTHNVKAMAAVQETQDGTLIHDRFQLQVLFQNGGRYHYQGVNREMIESFRKSEKPTTFLNAFIKPTHHCYRADPVTGEFYQPPMPEELD